MNSQNIDRQRHLEVINESIKELLTLHARTAEPAPLPHQYIGTIVDNTVGLLTAPANSLDQGARSIVFEQDRNWLSLVQAVHRSFFSSLHTATEMALGEICEKRGLVVTSRLYAAAQKAFDELTPELPDTVAARRAVKNLRNLIRTVHPGFNDYLELAISTSALPKDAQATWRKYFRALSIVRNKASHSAPALSLAEVEDLRKGGYGVMVNESGSLVMNPRMYFQAATHVLDFLDAVGVPKQNA
jgi:hypothetical protein